MEALICRVVGLLKLLFLELLVHGRFCLRCFWFIEAFVCRAVGSWKVLFTVFLVNVNFCLYSFSFM